MIWEEYKKEMLRDPKVKQAYDDLEPAYDIAKVLIQARLDEKLTQAELASRAGVTKDTIAKFKAFVFSPSMRVSSSQQSTTALAVGE